MDDSEKSFAAKYGLQKISKNTISPVVNEGQTGSASLCRRTYKVTETNDGQLKQLEKRMKNKTGRPVGQSSIIRALIQLCATDMGVQQKTVQLITTENVHWGRPKSSQ